MTDHPPGARGRLPVHPLLLVGAAPLLPMLVGSAINIWFNVTNIDLLLTPGAARPLHADDHPLHLLTLVPRPEDNRAFAMSVGGLGIALGLTTAWLLGRLVTEPVDELRRATRAVAAGDFRVRIPDLRADEFGQLIDGFNTMVAELREKRRLEEDFGRHVGERIARQILGRERGLGGVEEELTVVFVDIRNFTARSAAATPGQVVGVLNLFLTEMVDVIEQRHGGIVNKFLGDGLMALFAEWTGRADHADAAVAAGRDGDYAAPRRCSSRLTVLVTQD